MKYTNNFSLPQSLIDVIQNKTYDLSEADPTRLGVTTLIHPAIVRLLTVRHWNELEEDISDHIWRVTGNAYHYILAKTDKNDRLIERKLQETVDDITIVGKLDLYEKKNKSIEDWKVTSVWAVKLGTKEDWETQLNCYAWLLRKAGFEVKEAYINAILRDWRKKESKKYTDYPKIPFSRIKVNLLSFDEQQKYVEERVKLYKSVMDLPDDKLPICTPKERWAKEDTWAVYKDKNKTALRVFKTEDEAIDFTYHVSCKTRIEQRVGTDMKCQEYCLVNKFCSYYKQEYNKKKKHTMPKL